MNDYNTWEYLAQNHFQINKGAVATINPILVFVYVINMRANPLITKQLLVDLEFSILAFKI